MKRNGVLIVAILVAVLLGLLVGRLTAPEPDPTPGPDPAAGLVVETDEEEGCVTVSVERDSEATFLAVEVETVQKDEGTVEQTRRIVWLTRDTPAETFCRARVVTEPSADAAAAAPGEIPEDPADEDGTGSVKIYKVKKVKDCEPEGCVDDTFDDFPHPWPPGS